MIHATCHTADNVRCIEFDATPWFSEADTPSIIDLAQRGWASTAIADSLERRRGYERLHDLVEYAAKRNAPLAFQMGVPAQDAFPFKLWSRIVTRETRRVAAAPVTYPDPRGDPELRRRSRLTWGWPAAFSAIPLRCS
jgi:DNA-binding transcriptional MocR family regulator